MEKNSFLCQTEKSLFDLMTTSYVWLWWVVVMEIWRLEMKTFGSYGGYVDESVK
jgi:hypothetical protein